MKRLALAAVFALSAFAENSKLMPLFAQTEFTERDVLEPMARWSVKDD